MVAEQPNLRSIVIVGGGLSGVLLALRAIENPGNRVVLIERSSALGRGVAYGACDHAHLLNVPVFRMEVGLTPTFEHWLRANRPHELNTEDGELRDSFVTRRSFGDYIEEIVEHNVAAGRLKRLRGEVVEIGREETPYVLLKDGRVLKGDQVVLATGNLPPKTPRFIDEGGVLDSPVFIPDPWDVHRDRLPAGDGRVLLIGAGLTMVDVALRLVRNGHTGPITALSRHGLLPSRHAHGGEWRNAFHDRPLPPLQAFRLLRRETREAAAQGVPWQRVIDAVRPSLASIWISWDSADRRRFLRHCRTIWDVRRHRMPTAVATQIEALVKAGALDLRAGRIQKVDRAGDGAIVTLRPRGARDSVQIEVDAIINCTGPRSSFDDMNEPAFVKLKERGLLVADELGLGVRTFGCAVVDRYSIPSNWLFAIGPLTRPEWWEITAVPEISAQSYYLAGGLGLSGQNSLLRNFVDLGAGI
ncbi:MAG TPA: FAD/NAD(P)-binding protein [Hansschlegelia sp.]